MQRVALVASLETFLIFFFFFFKIKQFAEGVVRKPDSLQNPYDLAASFHFLVLAVLSCLSVE